MNKLLNFPKLEIKNVRLFYLINAGLSFWLVEAIWFLYWGRFASYTTIGILFAALTFVWILLEIPTGAVADMFGRKLSTVIGCVFAVVGGVVVASAQNVWYLVVGGLCQNIARAFISGSLEALIYDNLKSLKEEKWYDDVISAKTKITLFMYGTGTVLGGFLYLLYFRLPNIVSAVVQGIILILALSLVEVETAVRPEVNFKNYLIQNLEGFRQLFRKSLRPYLILIISVMTIFYLYDWGFSKPAMALSFGYQSSGMGIIYALMALVNIFIVAQLPYFREKLGDVKGLLYLTFILGLGFALSTIPWGLSGVIILLLIESVGALSDPWVSVIVNREINSQDRATALSSLEFVSKLPFIVLIIFAGSEIENRTISQLHLGIGVILMLIVAIYLLFSKKTNLNSQS